MVAYILEVDRKEGKTLYEGLAHWCFKSYNGCLFIKGKEIINNSDAKKELDRFISKYFGSYEILDEEKGIIPMSSNLPEQASVKNWVNIGTRAGNVKPSTGYAFKNMYRHAQLICEGGNIKSKKVKPKFLARNRVLLHKSLAVTISTLHF